MRMIRNIISTCACLAILTNGLHAQDKGSPADDFNTLPTIRWKFNCTQKIYSSPILNDGIVYAGGSDSILHAIDLVSGKQKWQFRTGGEIRSAVCIHDNHLFLNGGDGTLYCLDKKSGTVSWTFKSKAECRYDFADYFNSTPVIKNNMVFFGSGDSCMYAVSAENGKMQWSFKTNDVVHNTPAFDDEKLYFGSFDGNIYALHLADGRLEWKFKTVGHDYFPKGEVEGSPAVFDGMVFIGARDYNVYALDAAKGYAHWNKAFSRGWGLCTQVHDSILYIGSADERVLIAADPLKGKEMWNKKMEFLVFGNNAYTANMLYVGTTIGKMHGIDLRTGEKKWSFETEGYEKNRAKFFKPDDSYRDDIHSIIHSNEEFLDAEIELGGIFSTPVVTGDFIIFTSTEGSVYCLKRS